MKQRRALLAGTRGAGKKGNRTSASYKKGLHKEREEKLELQRGGEGEEKGSPRRRKEKRY